MYCSNCGTEVADDQKFCGSCGSSLVPAVEASPPERDDEVEDEEDDTDYSWLFSILKYAAIAAVLYFFVPSDKAVEAEVAHDVIDTVSYVAGKSIGYDIGWLVDGKSFTDKEAIKVAKNFGKITVDNYYLFKIGHFTPVNKKEGAPVAIGICGFTYSWLTTVGKLSD